MSARVIDALRRFLPAYLASGTALHEGQRRAVWAISHCRTAVLGGRLHVCAECGTREFAYHSCNHRACPQCGRADTARWVHRQLQKRLATPYFMVTFTVPSELRALFFGCDAKSAFDCLFGASSEALARTLASPRWLGASHCGFTGILHTWNQRLLFHPHVHFLVPGGGLDEHGDFVRVKNANFLVPVRVLSQAFRQRMRLLLEAGQQHREVDPVVWDKPWGVHIQPFGDGSRAIQYLGAYVCRTAIGDARIVSIGEHGVAFRWKDRSQGGRQKTECVSGLEFVARYLRHILPRGLRSIRYFGFCHPAARVTRERVAFLSGRTLFIGPVADSNANSAAAPRGALPSCRCCHKPMTCVGTFRPLWGRAPPLDTPKLAPATAPNPSSCR